MTEHHPLPCPLRRQDCLVGPDLGAMLQVDMVHNPRPGSSSASSYSSLASESLDMSLVLASRISSATATPNDHISRLESILTTYPPIFEALLLHLPTSAIFDIYHTSRPLRFFLRQYPLAWRHLSFRMLPPAPIVMGGILEQPTSESTSHDSGGRICALAKLLRVILPFGTCLTQLDLDNTSISGTELYSQILDKQRHTIEHLSVRGCKDVSLKYHILPFLELELSAPADLFGNQPLALKSLYVYRCRHHRRRPYLPSSLSRRDSDSQPTHQFIELCHRLGIWTDTAWCPVPGPRCHRRKDYYVSRHGTLGDTEIWVPFDRLWRSQNIIGATDEDLDPQLRSSTTKNPQRPTGKLWEEREHGYAGEALGSTAADAGEGKGLPTHLRQSHRMFVEGFTCDACGDKILERCEQCSIRMHCMGCRKTLCASCAFDRPLKRKQPTFNSTALATAAASAQATGLATSYDNIQRIVKSDEQRRRNKFWWAPGSIRSPNKMSETSFDPDSSDDDGIALLPTLPNALIQGTQASHVPRLDMHWCCLKPSFSGGGGIGYVGAHCGDNIKAAPLPRGRGFEDPSFTPEPDLEASSMTSTHSDEAAEEPHVWHQDPSFTFNEPWKKTVITHPGAFDILPYLEQDNDPASAAEMRSTSPRSLCGQCYASRAWRVLCGACKYPLCIDHDIKSLNAIKCGYRNLTRERETVQAAKNCLRSGEMIPVATRAHSTMVFFHKWRPIVEEMRAADRARAALGSWAPADKTGDRQSEDTQRSGTPSASDLTASIEEPESDVALLQDCGDSTQQPIHLRARRAKSVSQISTLQRSSSSPSPEDATMSPPSWHGCGQYFCPSPRATGDPRPRCAPDDYVRSCSKCGVNVCQGCMDSLTSVPCACSRCSMADFLCPNCSTHPSARKNCVWAEEQLAKAERHAAAAVEEHMRLCTVMERWEDGRAEREEADQMAEGVAEFMGAVEAW